ncbi:oxidoreductase, partial [Enterococcus faecalis]
NNIKSTIISPGAVQTELYQTISYRVVAETLHLEQLSWGLKAEDIAQAEVFAIDTPDRMSISEKVVRPTTQTI